MGNILSRAIPIHTKMPHAISAVILKGDFDSDIANAYDLLAIKLSIDLTMFPIDLYYTACWAKMLNIPGYLPGQRSSLLFPDDLVIAHLMSRIAQAEIAPLFAIIQTDYFGGVGEQWARVYRGTELADKEIDCISHALRFLGVICQDAMDEFDTVGLSKHRSMPDYLEKYVYLAEQLGV
jgi:hypothetical protein